MGAIDGWTEPQYDAVREAATEVLARQSSGLAVAVVVDGRLVADLWGGTVGEHGLVHTWSVIKPVTATCLLLAAERHGVELATPVREIWPELRAAADGRLTVHGVLAHRAGLVAVPFGGQVARLVDGAATVTELEAAVPTWPAGTAAGEHALTYGALVGELVRRVDGRSLGTFLRDELARPYDLDVHVGLDDGALARAVDLDGADAAWWASLSADRPTLRDPLGTGVDEMLVNGEAWRRAEIGAVNGHVTARAMARFWALALDGTLPRVIVERVDPEPDLVLGRDVGWTAGSAQWEVGSVGMGGVGGSYAGVVPESGVAWAFLTAAMGDYERTDVIEAAVLASVSHGSV